MVQLDHTAVYAQNPFYEYYEDLYDQDETYHEEIYDQDVVYHEEIYDQDVIYHEEMYDQDPSSLTDEFDGIGTPFGIEQWPRVYAYNGFFRFKPEEESSGYSNYPSYKASGQVVTRNAFCQNTWDGTVHLVDESTRFSLTPRLGDLSRTQQCLWVFRALRPNMLIRFHCNKINIGPPSPSEDKNLCRVGQEGLNHFRFTDPRLSEVMCQDVTWAEYVTRAGFLNITLKVYGGVNVRPSLDCHVTGRGPCNCGIENTETFQPVLHRIPEFRYARYTFSGVREGEDVSRRFTSFSEYVEESKITPAVYEHHNNNNDQEDNEYGARVKRNTMKYSDSRGTYRFPWTALVMKDGYLCTATILSEYWLITTGTCAMQVPHGIKFRVKTNNNKYYRGYQGIPHEEFDLEKFNENLGMIQMAEKIKFFDYTVLPICTHETHYDQAWIPILGKQPPQSARWVYLWGVKATLTISRSVLTLHILR
ncbi:hypothetical protein Pcinc_027316 [Petrolisthes cinctipes]|uniref:Peptidase S1 domain-containing protein n=1 Tax=Petrolisthes cinctipes TaxID=88211 RepID=A0AAE1F5D5_PETCI|nr:hypothetical protein Pcinc_027316 [Petrolisthes cinctipes]